MEFLEITVHDNDFWESLESYGEEILGYISNGWSGEEATKRMKDYVKRIGIKKMKKTACFYMAMQHVSKNELRERPYESPSSEIQRLFNYFMENISIKVVNEAIGDNMEYIYIDFYNVKSWLC